ncbi:DUF7848 domain-containing protein [Streptomyces olivaceoviridis]
MARATYRLREHTLTPEHDKPALHTMECQACGQASVDSADPTDGTRWAADHFKANPGHFTYLEHIERSYRFEPGAWQ